MIIHPEYSPANAQVIFNLALRSLTSSSSFQADLFEKRPEKSSLVSEALDAINGRLGEGSIFYASKGVNKSYDTFFLYVRGENPILFLNTLVRYPGSE